MPVDQVKKIFSENITEFANAGPISIPDMLADLKVTAERGYAIAEQEYEKDINAVAAPIFDAEKHPVASIAIVGPSFRLTKDRLPLLGDALQKMTQVISNEVGLMALSAIVTKTRTLSAAR